MARKKERYVPLIEVVAQHESRLSEKLEVAERQAGERIADARRRAETIRLEARDALDAEIAAYRRESAGQCENIRATMAAEAEARLEQIRVETEPRMAVVVDSLMHLILPGHENGSD